MGALQELQEAAARVADAASSSVVVIGGGRGAGVVVGDGRVLTNAHNVGGEEVSVTFAGGRTAAGRVAGADADGDLAVISVDTAGAQPVSWNGAGMPAVGSVVFALTQAGSGPRVTFGIVSSAGRAFRGPRGRRIPGSIEHTAALARGSSGSPLLDAEGRLVGLNTNRLGDGFYLAIPADASLRERIDALARGEEPVRPRLGVAVAPPRVARHLRRAVGLAERDGLLVRWVEPGGAAEAAGLRQGDLIVAAGGREVAGADDLHSALDATAPGSTLELRIVRGAEERTVIVFSGIERGEA